MLCSVAKVERLSSIAGYISSSHRKALIAQGFEAVLFLNMNNRFWNTCLASIAFKSIAIQICGNWSLVSNNQC